MILKKNVILNVLLILTIPFMMYIKIGESNVNFALSDVFLIIVGFLFLFNIKEILKNKQWLLILYFVGLLLSIILSHVVTRFDTTNNHVSNSVFMVEMVKSIIIAIYFFSPIVLLNNLRNYKITLLSISFSCIPVIIIGFLSYSFHLYGKKFFIGMYELNSQRFTGTFNDPNLCALFFIMILFISLFNYRTSSNKIIRFSMLTICFISIVIIGLTFSRGGWLAATGAIVVFIILNIRNLGKESILFLTIAVMVILIVLNVDYLNKGKITDLVIRRVEDTLQSGKDESRIQLFNAAYKMGNDNPILGVGRGGFAINSDKYLPRESLLYNQKSIPHNTILGFYSQQGIIGLIIFLILPIYLLYIMIRSKKRQNLYFIPLYVAFFLHSLTINIENIRFIWIVMGLILSSERLDFTLEFIHPQSVRKKRFVTRVSICLIINLVLFINISRKIAVNIYVYNNKTYEKRVTIDEPGEYLLSFDVYTDYSNHMVEIYRDKELYKKMEFYAAYGSVKEKINIEDELMIKYISNDSGWMRIKNAYIENDTKKYPLYNYVLLPTFIEKYFNDKKILEYMDEQSYRKKITVEKNKLNELNILRATLYKYSNLSHVFEFDYKSEGNIVTDYQIELFIDYDSLSYLLLNETQKNDMVFSYNIYPFTSNWKKDCSYLGRYNKILTNEKFKLYGRYYDIINNLYAQDSYFPITFTTINNLQEVIGLGNSEWINKLYVYDENKNILIKFNGWVETRRMNLIQGDYTIKFTVQGSKYDGEYSKVRIRDSYLNVIDEFYLDDTMKEYSVDYHADEYKEGISFILELINYKGDKDIGSREVLLDNTLIVE